MREDASRRLFRWHCRVMRPMTSQAGYLCLLLLMTRKTRIHWQGIRSRPNSGSISLLARNGKVTLHAIGRFVVVMGKLDIAEGAREPQDLTVFARVTLSALRRSSG